MRDMSPTTSRHIVSRTGRHGYLCRRDSFRRDISHRDSRHDDFRNRVATLSGELRVKVTCCSFVTCVNVIYVITTLTTPVIVTCVTVAYVIVTYVTVTHVMMTYDTV